MFRGSCFKLRVCPCIIFLLAGFTAPFPAEAQGFVSAVPSRARVFPEIASGVIAMKRDSAGRYYILATPPDLILTFSSDGKRIGQIPNLTAQNGKIQYAVDFDLDANGRVLVADRAANAVEIFSPEGALVAKVPVFAPTGVVALPDGQFAVSTLRSKRLVEIRSDDGALVRSFGDPGDAGLDPNSKQLQKLGKVSGDGDGDIFFAFTALADPTVRRYDRFGYVTSEAIFSASMYDPSPAATPDDRVQFGINFSETNFSDSYNAWTAVGNRGDILFGGGLSPGLGARTGHTAQSATEDILSTASASGPGGGGPGGMAGGGMVSAQGSYQQNSLQLHAGGGRAPEPAQMDRDRTTTAVRSMARCYSSILRTLLAAMPSGLPSATMMHRQTFCFRRLRDNPPRLRLGLAHLAVASEVSEGAADSAAVWAKGCSPASEVSDKEDSAVANPLRVTLPKDFRTSSRPVFRLLREHPLPHPHLVAHSLRTQNLREDPMTYTSVGDTGASAKVFTI